MKLKTVTSLVLFFLPFSLLAEQSYYCPQKHGYIKTGMTPDQVISACGQPVSQHDSNQPVLRKVEVQQLIYNNKGTSTAFYGVWNIPMGSGGTTLEIDIIDNKVKTIKMDGTNDNAFSICEDNNIQVGDSVGKVFGACGSPSLVNVTYINQIIPTADKPKVWIYKPGPYQPTITLTFVDGTLQSIR